MISFLPRVILRESLHVGDWYLPPVPSYLLNYQGPYKQRRIKRWRQGHPGYYRSNGHFYFLDKTNEIICHPDDVVKVAEIFKQKGFQVL